MIISEKQLLQLIRVCDSYCQALHRFGETKLIQEVQDLLDEINGQQSEELKEIE